MANLQVKNVPDSLHERLRRHAQEQNITLGAAVLNAVERELARAEWRRRLAERPITYLGTPAADLLVAERSERETELG
ncbi:MAG: toxin-antitoxin system HicB family antitoxin [Chloroflexi bacterium]|nr:toxin-antitoxin system HicB family antitoxin [Chloroflexota bacterium]